MSIADKIVRLTTARNNIRTALSSKGVAASTHGFEDFATDIQSITAGSAYDTYEGSYQIEPGFTSQVLATQGKVMTSDLVIDAIGVTRTLNASGQRVVRIGGSSSSSPSSPSESGSGDSEGSGSGNDGEGSEVVTTHEIYSTYVVSTSASSLTIPCPFEPTGFTINWVPNLLTTSELAPLLSAFGVDNSVSVCTTIDASMPGLQPLVTAIGYPGNTAWLQYHYYANGTRDSISVLESFMDSLLSYSNGNLTVLPDSEQGTATWAYLPEGFENSQVASALISQLGQQTFNAYSQLVKTYFVTLWR